MGAELQRKREGRRTRTGMSEKELEKWASKPHYLPYGRHEVIGGKKVRDLLRW
jgi:hypothetical protein